MENLKDRRLTGRQEDKVVRQVKIMLRMTSGSNNGRRIQGYGKSKNLKHYHPNG
jgi:hypothetical protein